MAVPKTPRARRERKLPVQQLSILAICRFAEPIASTSLLPYLPEMVRSFHVPPKDVGLWAGLCSTMFSLSQAVMGITWGRLSDRFGRKPAILIGLTSTMITMLIWGFSTNLAMAIFARTLAGAANGNVGIIRTTVAEMVPFKELQPRAFSLMPLVWNVGSVIGPMLGGALANPLNIRPDDRRLTGSLLERYPYALPNIVAACFFAVGIISGILFLEETMEAARDRKDYGLILGRKITAACRSYWSRIRKVLTRENKASIDSTEHEPLLQSQRQSDEENGLLDTKPASKPKQPPPPWKEVLNRQATLNLIAYTMLACHAMAYDQLNPVFLQSDPIYSGSPDSTPYSPPLKFAGGFGFDRFTIGMLSTVNGVFGMIVQFFLFPPLARKYGSLFWLRLSSLVFPVVYILTPFTALLPTRESQLAVTLILMTFKNMAGVFAFPSSTILLTNSASSLRTLGTLNGIATSSAAVGRAVGPAVCGAVITLGMKKGYVILPWWLMAIFAGFAAMSTFRIEEGPGFGGDDEVSDSEDDEDEDDIEETLLDTAATAGASQAAGSSGQPILPAVQIAQAKQEDEQQRNESDYGDLAPLSRTTTANSSAIADEDAPSSGTATTATQPRVRRASSSRQRITRKVSMPLGTGREGISRRYSSNLGQSFGSAGSMGGC